MWSHTLRNRTRDDIGFHGVGWKFNAPHNLKTVKKSTNKCLDMHDFIYITVDPERHQC